MNYKTGGKILWKSGTAVEEESGRSCGKAYTWKRIESG